MRARRLKSLIASAAALAMTIPSNARAWGPQGHLIIWNVAMARLTPAVLARIHAIETAQGADITITYQETYQGQTRPRVCGTSTPSDLANWADCVRYAPDAAYNHTADYHFDDIPWCGDIPPKPIYCPGDDCNSAQLERYIATLRDSPNPRERMEALAYLIHFVGDLHQPLHTITNGQPRDSDNGGNGVLLTVDTNYIHHDLRRPYNLHALWDSGILSVTPGLTDAQGHPLDLQQSVTQLAAQNATAWEANDRAAIVQLQQESSQHPGWLDHPVRGDVWAHEGHAIAVDAYNQLPVRPACGAHRVDAQPLDANYVNRFTDTVRTQLAKAAVRLADLLNETLG